jgi:hypothetical protein
MFKSIDKWLFGYLASVFRRPRRHSGMRHLIVAVCDHFEPFRGGTATTEARRIVRAWTDAYPKVVDGFLDADGCPPKHTFFYPEEEYDEQILDQLAGFCRAGYGEVEIHLHHRNDTAEGLRKKLVAFRDLLHERHGLLGEEKNFEQKLAKSAKGENGFSAGGGKEKSSLRPSCSSVQTSEFFQSEVYGLKSEVSSSSPIRYGFIHGNWALCNSRPDGDWCGVNEELGILAETGCYADFTFPSLPSETQPRMVNAIYYANDTPGRPRGADRGVRVKITGRGENNVEQKPAKSAKEENYISAEGGEQDSPSRSSCASVQTLPLSLLLITGPVALHWRKRKWGVLPRLENGEISGANPPSAERVRLWAQQQIGVCGRPDWVFVKLHTHGCVPENASVLLGEKMRAMHEMLRREFNDGKRWQLHYVTAREMYNLVKAAEQNLPGPPAQYRDTPISWKP